MKTKKLTLISFFVPFLLGGGFISVGGVLDRFAKPDTDDYKIIFDGFLDFLYSGTILGVFSTALVLIIVAVWRFVIWVIRKSSNK